MLQRSRSLRPRKRAKGTKVVWTAKPLAEELPAKKREKPASWKTQDAAAAQATRTTARPASYHGPSNPAPELVAALVPGGAVITNKDMCLGLRGTYPFPTLILQITPPPAAVSAGALLMYAGSIRTVETAWVESQKTYVNVNVIKHTFITPLGRCIIHDLDMLDPA